MFDINGWELVIILVVALLVIGPERLPEYVARLRQGIRDLKKLADGAKTQLRDQMGPEFDDVDWSAYDPRQYDPRRIVREALMDDSPAKPSRPAPPPAAPREATHEAPGPGSEGPPAVPFDDEAT